MREMTFEEKNKILKFMVVHLSAVIAERASTNPAYQHGQLQELITDLFRSLNSGGDSASVHSYVKTILETPWESWVSTEAGSMPELAAIRYLLRPLNQLFQRSPASAEKLIDAFFKFVKNHGAVARLFCSFQAKERILVPVEALLAIHGVTDPELIAVTDSAKNRAFLDGIIAESIQAHSPALLCYLEERGYSVVASGSELEVLSSVLMQYNRSGIFKADKELSVLQFLINEANLLRAIGDEAIEKILNEHAHKTFDSGAAYSEGFAVYDVRAEVGNSSASENAFSEFSLKIISLLQLHRPRVWSRVLEKIKAAPQWLSLAKEQQNSLLAIEMTTQRKNEILKQVLSYLSLAAMRKMAFDREFSPEKQAHYQKLNQLLMGLSISINEGAAEAIYTSAMNDLRTLRLGCKELNSELPELAAINYLFDERSGLFNRSPESAICVVEAFYLRFVPSNKLPAAVFSFYEKFKTIPLTIEQLLILAGETGRMLVSSEDREAATCPKIIEHLVRESIRTHSTELLEFLSQCPSIASERSSALILNPQLLAGVLENAFNKLAPSESSEDVDPLKLFKLFLQKGLVARLESEQIKSVLLRIFQRMTTPPRLALFSRSAASVGLGGQEFFTQKCFNLLVDIIFHLDNPALWDSTFTALKASSLWPAMSLGAQSQASLIASRVEVMRNSTAEAVAIAGVSTAARAALVSGR